MATVREEKATAGDQSECVDATWRNDRLGAWPEGVDSGLKWQDFKALFVVVIYRLYKPVGRSSSVLQLSKRHSIQREGGFEKSITLAKPIQRLGPEYSAVSYRMEGPACLSESQEVSPRTLEDRPQSWLTFRKIRKSIGST